MTRAMHLSAVALAALCSCDAQTTIPVEHNDLGITSLEIERSQAGGTRVLTLRGIDDTGQELATAILRTGKVYVESDWGDPMWTTGSDLTIETNTVQTRRVAPDLLPHETPAPVEPVLAGFVRLHAVAEAIDREAGIRFSHPADEIAFDAANCAGATFNRYKVDGSLLGDPVECCADGVQQAFKLGGGSNINKLGLRQLNTQSAIACRASDGSNNNCTGTACYFGPCGANPWTASGTVDAAVFTPKAPNQNRCGYDDNGAVNGGEVNMQFGPYDGTQALKPGVAATCLNTWCVNGVATPGDRSLVLTVTTPVHPGSYVSTNIPSYTLTGQMTTGTYTGYYFGGGANNNPPAPTVNLQAVAGPLNDFPTFTWSNGPCSGNGASCSIPFTPTSGPQTQSVVISCQRQCGCNGGGGCGGSPDGCGGVCGAKCIGC